MNKITAEHLARTACVYIRQSTPGQLKLNHESRRLQYALRDRAIALGWTDVVVIDDDLGRSGSGTTRPGCERLLAHVCRGEVGAVLSVEASRLARNGRDWHTLLEFCGLMSTLLIDTDGIYDPRQSNDRLLLGMKGSMSEMELSLFRQRSQEALKLKAQRGELYTTVAIGYVRDVGGTRIEKDPDKRIRKVIDLIFDRFDQVHSVRQVHLWLLQEKIECPRTVFEDGDKTVRWSEPRYSSVLKILSNPIYAGAYAYGRTGSGTSIEAGRKVIRRGLRKPRQSWDILLKDHHDGYISWQTFERHQRVIANNTNSRGEIVRGAARTGEALLGGLLRCGHCGCKILVSYPGNPGYAKYHCRARFHLEGPQANCISFGARRVDEAVAAAVVKAVEPEGLRAAVSAIDDHAVTRSEKYRHTELAIEAARFEVQRAKRQYDRVDPDNRLVASELERRWNDRLDNLKQLEEKLQTEQAAAIEVLTDSERQALLEFGADVQRAWHHPAATNTTRKHIIRAVLCEVVVTKNNFVLDLTLHWQGGDHTQMKVPCNRTGEHRWVTSADVRSLIEVLARQTSDRGIAAILNRSGKRTAHGHTWTGGRIRAFRNDHKIAVYCEGERADRGEVTLEEAARLLGVDKMRVRRLITEGVITASHLCHAAPWIIRRDALNTPRVKQALRAGKSRSPVTINPNQQSLDISAT